MIKSFKTEIDPTVDQIIQIHKTIGVCRFLYNKYLYFNSKIYESMKDLGLSKTLKSFLSGYDFDKYVNNILSKKFPWIKEVSSKSRKQSIMNAETSYKKFFKGESEYPKFKKRRNQDVKCYFPKNNKLDLLVERHRIKVPTLGWVRLKEKGYVPIDSDIKSCTVSNKGNRYYISVTIEIPSPQRITCYPSTDGIGVDLGLKEFVVSSDGRRFKNINKSRKVRKIEKRLKREQRRLSRKYKFLKIRKRGEISGTRNIEKQVLRVQKLHIRLSNIRLNYIRNTVNSLVKTKPEYITIEDLNVRGMMKNRCLSKAIQKQGFYKFREILKDKCLSNRVELRVVNRFYPSSKTCNVCGNIKKYLNLSDRIYHCDICGYEIDRDLGASINLSMVKKYTLVT